MEWSGVIGVIGDKVTEMNTSDLLVEDQVVNLGTITNITHVSEVFVILTIEGPQWSLGTGVTSIRVIEIGSHVTDLWVVRQRNGIVLPVS